MNTDFMDGRKNMFLLIDQFGRPLSSGGGHAFSFYLCSPSGVR